MNKIRIFLVRHSESRDNLLPNKIGSAKDCPLTEKGIKQAQLLGSRFLHDGIIFDKIFCSSFFRAQETCRIINEIIKNNNISYWDALIEYNPGELFGQNRSELMADCDFSKKFINLAMGFKFPGGESMRQVERRIASFVEENIIYNTEVLKTAEVREQNYLLISHGMTAKSLIFNILGFDQSFLWRIKIDNASITHLTYNPDVGWFIENINDIAHLR